MKDKFTIREFQEKFQTHDDCFKYLCEQKWHNGYKCIRCGNTTYFKGRKKLWRKCKACLYDESPTAQTLFHKVKFDIRDAFYMMYRITIDKKGVSSMELHRETGIRQKTCWYFKRKIQQAMVDDDPILLKGTVEVDECIVGGEEENKQGRSTNGKKKLAMVMVEHVMSRKGKVTIGSAYAQKITGFGSDDLLPVLHKHVAAEAYVSADGWPGYSPIRQDYPNLYQVKSDKGKNFPLVHLHIMNVKGWIRGIHHHCSDQHFQAYMNEYHFRFNNHNNKRLLFAKLVRNMIAAVPLYISLRDLCA